MSVEQLITDHLDLWTGAVTHKRSAGRSSGKSRKVELTGIKKLRELILELAVRGKLVEQDPTDEPASVLLEKIAEEKTRLVKEGKIKKPKKLPEIDGEKEPFSIPRSWTLARLGEVVEIVRGITFPASEKSPSPETGRVACLRTSNVQDRIEWEDLLYIRNSFVSKSSQYVQKHDIVMSMANSRELVGKVAIIENTPHDPTAFGGFLGVIRPIILHPQFLMAVLRAPYARTTLIGSSSQTTNIANISIGKLNPFIIGIPPLKEQHRIVAKFDELMALCDQLEQQTGDQLDAHEILVDTLLNALTRAEDADEVAAQWARLAEHFDTLFTTEASIDKLKQAILQLAVMGRLVEQDPNDEPVTHFLQRHSITGKPYLLFGWAEVALGNFGEILGGSTPTKSNAEFWEGDIPWVSPKDMKSSLIQNSQDAVTAQALQKSSLKLIPKNSLLMVVRGMILAHSFPVAISGREVTINQDMKALVPPKEISPYLLLYLQAKKPELVKLVDRSSHGTCKLISEKLWSHLVYLPPIEEQHRIVAKVDELMALCDQLKAHLSDAGETRTQLAEAVVEGALG